MGTKYSTILVGGDVPDYGDAAPADDGTQVAANRVKYATVQTDIGNPLHEGIKDMDAKLAAHTNEGPDTEAGNVTLTTADHNKVLECTGTITVSVPNPSGNAGFQCTVKNAGSGVITVDVDGGANIDGVSSITLAAGVANKVYVNNAGTAYYSVTGTGIGDGFASGTIMLFEQNAAPTGWVKKTAAAYNNVGLRVSTGTVSDVTSGSVDFDTVFGLTATDGHLLTSNQSGVNGHAHAVGALADTLTGTGTAIALPGGGASSTGNISGGEKDADETHAHNIDLQLRFRDVIAAEKT